MELQDIGGELSAAAEAGDHDALMSLAGRYRTRFDELWAAMTPAARQASDLPKQAWLLHQRIVDRLIALRGSRSAEVRALKLAGPYGRRRGVRDEWHVTI